MVLPASFLQDAQVLLAAAADARTRAASAAAVAAGIPSPHSQARANKISEGRGVGGAAAPTQLQRQVFAHLIPLASCCFTFIAHMLNMIDGFRVLIENSYLLTVVLLLSGSSSTHD